MKTNLKYCLFLLVLTISFTKILAQSNVYQFNSLNEKELSKTKGHNKKGDYSINISRDETKMTIYWDLYDLSDRVDFDLLNKKEVMVKIVKDTIINNVKKTIVTNVKCTSYTGMSCAYKNYSLSVFYPTIQFPDVTEFYIVDKQANMSYVFSNK